MARNGETGFEHSVARIMGAPWPPPDGQGAPLDVGMVADEAMLAALSVALGAATVPRVTEAEATLLDHAPDVPGDLIAATLDRIEEGGDPLGDAFCALRPAARRRKDGAVYTPSIIVRSMLSWAEGVGNPETA